jgi:hypothetical protein
VFLNTENISAFVSFSWKISLVLLYSVDMFKIFKFKNLYQKLFCKNRVHVRLQTYLVFRTSVTTDNVRTVHEVLIVTFQRGRSKGGNFGIITIRSR